MRQCVFWKYYFESLQSDLSILARNGWKFWKCFKQKTKSTEQKCPTFAVSRRISVKSKTNWNGSRLRRRTIEKIPFYLSSKCLIELYQGCVHLGKSPRPQVLHQTTILQYVTVLLKAELVPTSNNFTKPLCISPCHDYNYNSRCSYRGFQNTVFDSFICQLSE